ncbi:MAG: hypothetical protein PHD20_02815 [Clostridia bacterium]|nr:hypothetical protein [Clostridia bacterium]
MAQTAQNEIKIGDYRTIAEQIGGNKFLVMTGSKFQYYGYNDLGYVYLMIKLTKNNSKAQYFKIQLNGLDLYDLTFTRIKKTLTPLAKELGIKVYDEEIVIVKEYKDVYADMLQDIFTSVTGLYTKLF